MGGAVRQAKFHGIPERCADHGVGNARIAAGGIDDCLAVAKRAASQTRLNHAQRWSILDGTSGVEPLGLGAELHMRKFAADSRQTQQRSVADQLEHSLPRPAMKLLCMHGGGVLRSGDGIYGCHALESPVSLLDMRPVYSELDAARQFDGI